MVCKNCGIANSDTSKFCSECGSVLPAPKQETAPAAEEPKAQSYTAPAPQPYVQPVYYVQQPVVPPVMPVPEQPVQNKEAEQPQAQPAQQYAPQPNPNPFGVPMSNSGSYNATPAYPPVQFNTPPVYGFPYPPFAYNEGAMKAAVWSLGLGIAATVLPIITCSIASPISIILGIIAIALGAANVNKVLPNRKSSAIAGIVFGIIGVIFSIIGFSVLSSVFDAVATSEEFKQFNEQFNSFIVFALTGILRIIRVAVSSFISKAQTIIGLLFF